MWMNSLILFCLFLNEIEIYSRHFAAKCCPAVYFRILFVFAFISPSLKFISKILSQKAKPKCVSNVAVANFQPIKRHFERKRMCCSLGSDAHLSRSKFNSRTSFPTSGKLLLMSVGASYLSSCCLAPFGILMWFDFAYAFLEIKEKLMAMPLAKAILYRFLRFHFSSNMEKMKAPYSIWDFSSVILVLLF